MKALQLFTPEYLESCKGATPEQICRFIEDFKNTYGPIYLKQTDPGLYALYLKKKKEKNDPES